MSASNTGFTAYSLLDSVNHRGIVGSPAKVPLPMANLPMALEVCSCLRSTREPRCRNIVGLTSNWTCGGNKIDVKSDGSEGFDYETTGRGWRVTKAKMKGEGSSYRTVLSRVVIAIGRV